MKFEADVVVIHCGRWNLKSEETSKLFLDREFEADIIMETRSRLRKEGFEVKGSF